MLLIKYRFDTWYMVFNTEIPKVISFLDQVCMCLQGYSKTMHESLLNAIGSWYITKKYHQFIASFFPNSIHIPTWCCVKTSGSLALSIWCTLVSKAKDWRWVANNLSWWSRIPSDLHQVGSAECQDLAGLGKFTDCTWYSLYVLIIYHINTYSYVYPRIPKSNYL